MKTVYLNVRVGLLKSTKDNMKKICKERGIGFGELLNETFKNLPQADCNVELMQFTGLLDKNEKEIYELEIIGNVYENPELLK